MAQGNHFLNIPEQEGLFTTIKSGRAGEERDDSAVEDEDEDETEEDVRLIPRCSPIPRKRGHSIADETAEYMRIRLVLPRRVSFADASGEELVDVREFIAFDSDDDEDDSNWEEEEAKCRRAYLEPVYQIWPEFSERSWSDLTHAVCVNKVEVERVTAVPEEPLAFDALICVLNVSYHKCVSVRYTMDGWITHYDSTAHYVQGSNDGDTDKFSARLSFTEPYLFNGARVNFVVRYETSDGEFWANNSGRNYSVSLLVSYERTSEVNKVEDREVRGILKPPRFSMSDDYDLSQDIEEGDLDSTQGEAEVEVCRPMCPHVIEPEIDIEIAEVVSSSKAREDPNPARCALRSLNASFDEQPLQDFSAILPQTGHIESKDHAIPTENTTVSIQKGIETKQANIDILPCSDRQIDGSAMSNQSFTIKQTDSHSDITAQKILGLDTASTEKFSGIQNVEECESEKLKVKRDNENTQSGAHREVQHIKASDMEAFETGNSLRKMQESVQLCPFSDLINRSESKGEVDCTYSTGQNIFLEDSCDPLVQKFKGSGESEMPTDKHEPVVRQEEQTALSIKSYQVSEKEAPGIQWQPRGTITHMGQTEEDRVTQSVPSLLRSELKGLTVSESKYLTVDMPVPTSKITVQVQDFTTTVEASEGEEESSTLTQEKQIKLLSHDEFKWSSTEPASELQNQEGLENQLSLSSSNFNAHSDEILGKTLIPSLVLFSVVVSFVVGFNKPIIIFSIVLLLISFCF